MKTKTHRTTKTTMSRTATSAERPVALVTGGAKRVGRAIALTLAQAGYDIAVTCHRSRAAANRTAADIRHHGAAALVINADLSHDEAVDQVYAAFTKRFSRLDALINNASIFEPTPLATLTIEAFDQHMVINARTPLRLIQRFAKLLGARGFQSPGRVVNFVDAHVLGQPMRDHVAYNASKAALLEITRSLARDLAPRITVNAIAPGVIAWASSFSDAQKKQYLKRVPLSRPGTPEDAAAAVLFLLRDANYITGEILRLDGGRSLT